MNKTHPMMNLEQKIITKYSQNIPYLDWSANNRNGVYKSGWNPFKGINICFRDELEKKNMVWFTIEISPNPVTSTMSMMPLLSSYMNPEDIFAMGFFFIRDPETNEVDLLYRMKPFNGRERTVQYHDCRYFGIGTEYVPINTRRILRSRFAKMSKFIVSNEWQDKALQTGLNLFHKNYEDFVHIVNYINNVIQISIVNSNVSSDVQAFPLLQVIGNREMPENSNSYSVNAVAEISSPITYVNYSILHNDDDNNDNNENNDDDSTTSSDVPYPICRSIV